VPVFVATTERVEVVDPLAVLDALTDSVPREEEDAVLDTVVLRVVVCVAVTVFVEVLLRVPGSVGLVDLVPAVVRVDVFDCVGVGEGNTLFSTRCLASTLSCRSPVKLGGGGGVEAILPKNVRSRSHLILQIHLTISLAPS
jgi:hypothetical protein